jgi:hypothetical protein
MAQINAKETTDEIIEESRRIKATLAESMNFDIDWIVAEARKKQEQAGRIVLSPPIRHGG